MKLAPIFLLVKGIGRRRRNRERIKHRRTCVVSAMQGHGKQ